MNSVNDVEDGDMKFKRGDAVYRTRMGVQITGIVLATSSMPHRIMDELVFEDSNENWVWWVTCEGLQALNNEDDLRPFKPPVMLVSNPSGWKCL